MFRTALPLAAALMLSLAACTPPEETPPMDEPTGPVEPAGDAWAPPPVTDDPIDPMTDPTQAPVDPMDPNAPPPGQTPPEMIDETDPTSEQMPPEDPEDPESPPTN